MFYIINELGCQGIFSVVWLLFLDVTFVNYPPKTIEEDRRWY
jgi:hypothetical protein